MVLSISGNSNLNGLSLALYGNSLAVDTEDVLTFLFCGAKAICDCGLVRLREQLLLSGSSQSDW
jgi:hypothetical protein